MNLDPLQGQFALLVMRNYSIDELDLLATMSRMGGPRGTGLEDTPEWTARTCE